MHWKEESPLGENNFRIYLPSICTSFSFSIQVTYSPNTVDTTSTDYFNVVAIGNISKAVIKCVGSSKGANMLHISIVVILKVKINEHICRIQNFIILCFSGPSVHLGAKSVNFMQIDLGAVGTKTVDIVNNSEVEATFQVIFFDSL